MAIIEFYVFGILYLKSPTHWNNAGRGKESTDHAQYNCATDSKFHMVSFTRRLLSTSINYIICSNGLHGLQSISRSLLDRIAWRVPYKCSRLTGSELSAFQA